jgi:hypothetical protein
MAKFWKYIRRRGKRQKDSMGWVRTFKENGSGLSQIMTLYTNVEAKE